MTHRPYRDETDLTLLLKWLSERAHTAYMHPGDLVWWLRKNATIDPVKALELFFDEQGDVQAMAFVDGSWSLLEGNADVPAQVWDDIVASVLMKAQDQGKLVFQPHETDTEQLATLVRAGFAPTSKRMLRLRHIVEPADLDAVELPEGFHFADMSTDEIRVEDRVKLHQHVWNTARHTVEVFRRMQDAPLYRPDLDLMVVAPSGELACYVLGWYDPASRSGLMEPVGTHADFRRQGLGKRMIREMTRRMAALGAQNVMIGGKERNVAATALYQSAGYRLDGYWIDYQRTQEKPA